MKIGRPHPALVERFRADLERLTEAPPAALCLAVSGGPDSLGLLLLAAAAYRGRVEAATVDHGLRPESRDEAAFVAEVCARLRVPHTVLAPDWDSAPAANLQAEARFARYSALCTWASGTGYIATGHHLDDQAETLLMRLARGAGLSGMAGIRPTGTFAGRKESGSIIRPLLAWRKAELEQVVAAAGIDPVRDPSNESEAFDRTAARRLLADAPWLASDRLAASASALRDSDDALQWTADEIFSQRAKVGKDAKLTLDPVGFPRELQRRLLLKALWHFTDEQAIPGPKLMRLLDALQGGQPGTLAGVQARPDPQGVWHFRFAPPRRDASR